MTCLTGGCAGAIASMSYLAELGMEMVSRVTDAGEAPKPIPRHKAENCSGQQRTHDTRFPRLAGYHALLRAQVHPPLQVQLKIPYSASDSPPSTSVV